MMDRATTPVSVTSKLPNGIDVAPPRRTAGAAVHAVARSADCRSAQSAIPSTRSSVSTFRLASPCTPSNLRVPPSSARFAHCLEVRYADHRRRNGDGAAQETIAESRFEPHRDTTDGKRDMTSTFPTQVPHRHARNRCNVRASSPDRAIDATEPQRVRREPAMCGRRREKGNGKKRHRLHRRGRAMRPGSARFRTGSGTVVRLTMPGSPVPLNVADSTATP